MGLNLALVIPDTHRPYHDVKAYRLMISVAKYLRNHIKEIVLLGDYADFYAVSSHGKDPSVDQLLIKEIEDVNEGLNELDVEFPSAKKIFIEGNHEWRLERYFCNQAPALYGITDLNYLFKMNERTKWSVIPYSPNQSYSILNSKLKAKHEPPSGPLQNAAKEASCSIVFGHVHRIISSYHVSLEGKPRGAYCPGWLGDKRKSKIFGYVKSHHQWQLGFALVWVDDKTRNYYIETVHILDNYTCVAAGKQFKL